jgi:hypothetical protein
VQFLVADLDMDGFPDLVGADGGSSGLSLQRGDGSGFFGIPIRKPQWSWNPDPVLVDLDHDGLPEVISLGASSSFGGKGTVVIYSNRSF